MISTLCRFAEMPLSLDPVRRVMAQVSFQTPKLIRKEEQVKLSCRNKALPRCLTEENKVKFQERRVVYIVYCCPLQPGTGEVIEQLASHCL